MQMKIHSFLQVNDWTGSKMSLNLPKYHQKQVFFILLLFVKFGAAIFEFIQAFEAEARMEP